jgi:chemotaxis signal transduction protein
MSAAVAGTLTYVIFTLGKRRYALDSAEVAELLRSGQVQAFPHTTPGLAGVLIHRNGVLPGWDVAQALIGPGGAPQKYFLIARCIFAGSEEWTAIPVSGECQLLHLEILPAPEDSPGYVRGLLFLDTESIEVLDLELLAALCMPGSSMEPAAEMEAGLQ